MKRVIQHWRRLLESCALDYPRDDLGFLEEKARAVRDIFLTDIRAKHPRANPGELADEDRLVGLLQADTTLEAVFGYRLQRALFLETPGHPWLTCLASLTRIRTAMDLYYSTEIGERFSIQHGFGIVIGPRYRIGCDFTIHQGVTLGQRRLNHPGETMVLGNRVTLFAGAKLLGNLRVGDDVQVGANAVLLQNAEPNSVYAGIPARRIRGLTSPAAPS